MSLQKRNISHKNILNKSGPNIDSCGTPTTISYHELNWSFISTLCSLSVKQVFISFNDSIKKTICVKFRNCKGPCEVQSKALERSVSKAPHMFPWSNPFLQFSTTSNRQSCVLYPFQKPHWNFKNWSFKIFWYLFWLLSIHASFKHFWNIR